MVNELPKTVSNGAASDAAARPSFAPAEPWKFEEFQCVTHINQPFNSQVLKRVASMKGRQFFQVATMMKHDTDRTLLIKSEALRPIKDPEADCVHCDFRGTEFCPLAAMAAEAA